MDYAKEHGHSRVEWTLTSVTTTIPTVGRVTFHADTTDGAARYAQSRLRMVVSDRARRELDRP